MVSILVVLSLLAFAAPTGAGGSDPVDPRVVDALTALQEHIDDSTALKAGEKRSLSSKLDGAAARYQNGQTCPAANDLDALANQLRAMRTQGTSRGDDSRVGVAEDLYNRVWMVRAALFVVYVEDPTLTPPRPCWDPAAVAVPELDVLVSDNTTFAATISFGSPILQTIESGGETWTQVFVPGLPVPVGAPGYPAIPSWQGLVAVPHGAEASLQMAPATPDASLRLNLYPAQDQAADAEPIGDGPYPHPNDFAELLGDPPFTKDAEVYGLRGFIPTDPCVFRVLGQLRDAVMGQVQCNAGQYDPVTDELRLFRSLSFEISFDGGDGTFISEQSLTPFEPAGPATVSLALNSEAAFKHVSAFDFRMPSCIGEELLILTHPDFRIAADALAAWKEEKGIATSVFEVGTGTVRDTGGEIDALIEERWKECMIRPSYLTIIGDSEWIPPARTDHDTSTACGGCGDMTTGSDLGYADIYTHLIDVFPEIGVGRISVDTQFQAQTVVDKIIQYESDPPFQGVGAGGPFYTTATTASYFQCCQTGTPEGRSMRSFIQTSETIGGALRDAGYMVERIYNTDTTYQPETVSDDTPRRYFDGTDLPAAIGPDSGFAWTGDSADVTDAFNDGRFNILHRGHGNSVSWASPAFSTDDFADLSNGDRLPVVYSVNCASGFWDIETDMGGAGESFMELLLRRVDGGMVGGIGDNRNSPTWANSALARGLYDATWPQVAPEFGGVTPKARLGDVLNHGRIYLLTQIGVAQPAGTLSVEAVLGDILMYHVFGDATLEMWTRNPHEWRLPAIFEAQVVGFDLDITYPVEGAVLTAFVEADGILTPYGRAEVVGDSATIKMFNPQPEPPKKDEIFLVASFDGAVSVLLQGFHAPDLQVTSMSLGEWDYVTPGEDLTDRLSLWIANRGDGPARGTVGPDGAPRTGYVVDLVLSSDTSVPPGFAVVPTPEGSFAEDGLLRDGRVTRTPDLAAGASASLPMGAPVSSVVGGVIPGDSPLGEMYLCARIDPGDAARESDETNNVRCMRITVYEQVR